MIFLAFLMLAIRASAVAPIYGQCGGASWTGDTTCATGSTCAYSNPYYSQCIPSSSTPTTTTTSLKPTTSTTSVSTTSKASASSNTSKTTSASTTSKTTATTTSSSATISSTGGPSRLVPKTPALGWNSWNAYGGNINEAKVLAAANSFISLGLKDVGYTYVNIDDCWSNITGRDPLTQRIRPDTTKFPNGINGLATAIHGLGLKFGIYGDQGTATCAGFPGSLGYEQIDAQTWSEWGVDYIKMDNCNVPGNWSDTWTYPDWYDSNSAKRYKQMTDALNTVSHPIFYSICNWGNANVWTWGARVGHSWRMTGDASPSWSFITSSISSAIVSLDYDDFWGHPDLDMMEIGNGALTIQEQRSHFAAWVFLKSPILLGTDLSLLSSAQLAIIKNAELLAFHQDTTIGAPAKPYNSTTSPPEYFSGKSSKGTHVFVLNTLASTASKVITFSAVPGLGSGSYKVHDMWAETDVGTFSGSYTFSLAAHDTGAFLVTPA